MGKSVKKRGKTIYKRKNKKVIEKIAENRKQIFKKEKINEKKQKIVKNSDTSK